MRTHNIVLAENQDGKLQSGYQTPPPESIWPSANVLPEIFPLRKMTAIDGAPADSYHKNSLEGVPWAYPYLTMLGAGPYFWVLRQGAPGMTIANGTFDENGKWTWGDGGTLFWDNPVAGTYQIVVDMFDQSGQVTWRHEHVCGDATKHIIVSQAGAGSGDGSSEANAMSWANAYLGDTTLSPTQGKVLHLIGGAYTATAYHFWPQYHSMNVVRYGGSTEPVFGCRFYDHGSRRFLSGVEFNDMEIATNGVIQNDVNADYFISWKNRFVDIRQDPLSPSSDNESCHTSMGTGGSYFRKGYVAWGNYYENVEVAATDMFSLEEFLNGNEVFAWTDPLYLTRGVNPVWYAKSGVRFSQICHNRFDNPNVAAGSGGIVHIQNAATQGDYARGFAEYNFIRCNGGNAIRSNTAANNLPIDAINWVRRNDVIGGNVDAKNFDSDAGESRYTYFDSNAIQNTNSATFGITPDSEGFEVVRHECVGASGVFDGYGNLTGAFITYLYTRGSVQGIAA